MSSVGWYGRLGRLPPLSFILASPFDPELVTFFHQDDDCFFESAGGGLADGRLGLPFARRRLSSPSSSDSSNSNSSVGSSGSGSNKSPSSVKPSSSVKSKPTRS